MGQGVRPHVPVGLSDDYSSLMAYRVQEILMVASRYDAFIIQEDGHLTERVLNEYKNLELNVRYAPRFTVTQGAQEALRLLSSKRFDLVISTSRLGDMRPEDFCARVKGVYPGVHVALVAAHAWDVPTLEEARAKGVVDLVFLWQGDVKVFLALIKQIEDRVNAAHDVLEAGVQVIVLVEDEVRFSSSFLPQIYAEVTRQTARLLDEGHNVAHRLLRTRARPKILLAQCYEEAWDLYQRFAPNLLGLISDLGYPHRGVYRSDAGLLLAREIRQRDPDLPILLQSSDPSFAPQARDLGAWFTHKGSPRLLEDIREFILAHFGFGDFVFKTPQGAELCRVRTIKELVETLPSIPEDSLEYHARRNDFSRWLKARSEFQLASLLRPKVVEDFPTLADLRTYLAQTIQSYLREVQRYTVVDFDPARFDQYVAFARIGRGSLGGKGRGLAFMLQTLRGEEVGVEGVEVRIPDTVVLSTEVFEEFITENDMGGLVHRLEHTPDEEVLRAFQRARFSPARKAELAALLEEMRGPLAVRSSSILEDSILQPFAGVYHTVMIPNNHPSLDVRLAHLLEAVRVVYASTYLSGAREYMATTPHRLEEERMAVLIQRLVGSARGRWFYPTFSGVALSYNVYPTGGSRPEDGVALVAMGLGKSVVEGREALRFCPGQPLAIPLFTRVEDVLERAQKKFFALDLEEHGMPGLDPAWNLVELETADALRRGEADLLASTYLPDSGSLQQGVVPGGVPLVTFQGLREGFPFSLPTLLAKLLKACERGFGLPVEVEFAMDLPPTPEGPWTFWLLQARPMVVEPVAEDLSQEPPQGRKVVDTTSVLGHGRSFVVYDLVAVHPGLPRSRTTAVAEVLRAINASLRAQRRSYVLIGPGRWGTSDPWLGIPVAWQHVNGALAIVETDFEDLEVEPSFGSHFFDHLTTCGVAYFTVHQAKGRGRVDWEWLWQRPHERYLDGAVGHWRVPEGLKVVADQRSGRGGIIALG